MKLYSGDAEAALRIVNAEESNPTACDIIPVLYFVGPRLLKSILVAKPRAGNSAANIAHPETRGMLPKAPLYHRSKGTSFVSLSNVRRAYYR